MASVTVLILSIAFIYEQFEKENIRGHTSINYSQNFSNTLKGMMTKKSELGITNAVGITNASEIEVAAANSDPQALNKVLQNIGTKYREMTGLKNIKMHFTDEKQQSFYKSWKPLEKQSISDLSNRGYLKKLATEQKPMVVYAVSSAGFNIKSIIPIIKDGKYEGGVELIQGVGSIRRDFASNNQSYLLAVSKEYILAGDKFRQMNAKNIPVSSDGKWVVGNDKQFSLEYSGQQIETLSTAT